MQEPFSNLGVAENAFFDKNFIATSKENIILFCTRNDEVYVFFAIFRKKRNFINFNLIN